ncbi:hypothetical protein [Pseudoalteromonas denitrificans]|uniref:hypothetical protein n=1 Tax=Pseudoalteromonas denitrificans TaxID=43656 RepID=UPI0015A4FF42|nr:hypothetical protein [Pseudoalteromonas denitrificans]
MEFASATIKYQILYNYLPKEEVEQLDKFDENQLSYVLKTSQLHSSMVSAGK